MQSELVSTLLNEAAPDAAGARGEAGAPPPVALRVDATATEATAPEVDAGRGWQFWIDRGGTFTDIVARRPDGGVVCHKLLSESPGHYADAALHGIRSLLGLGAEAPLSAAAIEAVRMGTTVATNALLERKGEPTALVITKGFGDALRLGYQNRPQLFSPRRQQPELLHRQVVEIDERMTAEGQELRPVDLGAARRDLEAVHAMGIGAVAIVLMHGYAHPEHERQVAELAREIGFTQISVSHRVSPLMKLVSRGDTTVVDAYLSPLLRRYLLALSAELGATPLLVMQSHGGLADARRLQGKDAVLSGPAGGIVGAVRTAAMGGFLKIISFDMGGTSTDVAHYDHDYERTFDTQIAGVRMRAPMMQIHTVAAGGGSILHFDGARCRVGPESAGADPGPACYRRGGPLTVTDANVMLGRLVPAFFPKVFGPGGDEPIDAAIVRARFADLASRIAAATGGPARPEDAAAGFRRIAVENMANAIKKISTQRGHDVSAYTLNCFGGAGGQHACDIADTLGMRAIFIHPFAGVLSAYGMGLADLRLMREQAVEKPLGEALMPELARLLDALTADARAEMLCQAAPGAGIEIRRLVHLRSRGSDTALVVAFDEAAVMFEAFAAAHRQRFGFVVRGKELLVEAVSVEAVAADVTPQDPELAPRQRRAPPRARALVPLYQEGAWVDCPVHDCAELGPGDRIEGPAIVIAAHSTIVVEAGWRAELTPRNHLVMTRHQPRAVASPVAAAVDPVMLEIFNNLFMSIAEQMGTMLEKTAHSVNIKERLDFSCAVFDAQGGLVANAPHIPVHLGSMGESVATVIREHGQAMRPGDVYVLNAPYNGGTHLPDMTVVAPVFDQGGKRVLFHVANRGHHADVGGVTPGSMPPGSRSVDEEGVLIDNVKLVEGGELREEEMLRLLAGGRHPARNPQQNLADFRAQIAANEKGAQELGRVVRQFGAEVVQAYMQHVQDNAEAHVRRVLGALGDGAFASEMDNGARIAVRIAIDKRRRRARIDFSGSSPQQPSNFNAPAAVCRAAVLYVFRTLIDDDIPLNEGCLRPLEIVVPAGSMLNPRPPGAVVAGNVETSQVITNTLYGALGVMAAAQGTMNNFTFGDATYQYYETLGGGSGAGPDFDGTDGYQTHMTNSRLTDPEVLEWRFPVLVESYEVRRGSGGRGRHQGGDGVRRRIRFRAPMTAAILSGSRRVAPFGLAGGLPGMVGRNWVERADGSRVELGGIGEVAMRPGDVFVIETPGGGGYGAPAAQDPGPGPAEGPAGQ